MKNIPILFSEAMVMAILTGRKSQTRRLVKPVTPETQALMMNLYCGVEIDRSINELLRMSPYGQAGDVLWVRETHYRFGVWVEDEGKFTKTGKQAYKFIPTSDEVRYFDMPPAAYCVNRSPKNLPEWYLRPSIHMPKTACRIFLKLSDTRIELLHDISESDAVAEGIEPADAPYNDVKKYGWRFKSYDPKMQSACLPKASFETLWKSIHGAECWNVNPLVYALSFKQTKQPKDFIIK